MWGSIGEPCIAISRVQLPPRLQRFSSACATPLPPAMAALQGNAQPDVEPEAVTIDSVPDAVLSRALGLLTQRER